MRFGTLRVLGVVDAEVLAVRVQSQHGADTVASVESQLSTAQRELEHSPEPRDVTFYHQVREQECLVPGNY